MVRQPVRNDYPLLACLELGAQAVRCPWTDLDPSGDRLRFLRSQGVQVQATILDDEDTPYDSILERRRDQVDTWEIQTPGGPWPSSSCLYLCKSYHRNLRLSLTPVIPGQQMAGKQQPPDADRLPARRSGSAQPSVAKRRYLDRSGPVPAGRSGPLGRCLGLARGTCPDHDRSAGFAL